MVRAQRISSTDSTGQRRLADAASGLAGIGGLVGALGASTCCVLPLVLFSLGATGPWLGQLTALSPLQPWLLGATAVVLALGFYLVYRRPRGACADDDSCFRRRRRRLIVSALWAATVVAAVSAAFPYVAPAFLDG